MASNLRDNKNKIENLLTFGFDKEVNRVELGLCPFCGLPVKLEDFKDEISRKEFNISGICQKCQDETFN